MHILLLIQGLSLLEYRTAQIVQEIGMLYQPADAAPGAEAYGY